MGLEFSSANLNNQMWEQKKTKKKRAPLTIPPPLFHTSNFKPPPLASSLLPPARSSHKRSSVRPNSYQDLLTGQGKGREMKGGGERKRRDLRKREEGLVYLIRQNCRLLITTPFSQQASKPHPASVNMEHRASQSPQRSLSSNGRIKTVQSDFLCLHGRFLKELNLFPFAPIYNVGGLACNW